MSEQPPELRPAPTKSPHPWAWTGRLGAALGVLPGEGTRVLALAGLYGVFVFAFVFVQAATFSLFIGEFGPQLLSLAYLSIAVLASLVAVGLLRLSERVSLARLQYLNVGFMAGVSLLFWIGIHSPLRIVFVFLLPFWFQTFINLANLCVWPMAGRMFDLRQAKRLFGLIGAGNWLATALGGFVVAPAVAWIGTENLLLPAAVVTAGGALAMRRVLREYDAHRQITPPRKQPVRATSAPPADHARNALARDPYVRLLLGYVVLWWVSFYFVDNMFYDRAAAQYPDADQLSGAIGQLLALMGVIALPISLFLSGRIIGRFGVRGGLLLEPALVVLAVAGMAAFGLLRVPGVVLFGLIAAGKVLNSALGFSLSQTSKSLLYQPLPDGLRVRVQTLADGIVQPIAIGVAAVLLLVFATLLRFDAVQLAWVFLPIGLLFLGLIARTAREYPVVLGKALQQRHFGDSPPNLDDPAGRAALRAALRSDNPGVVAYALDLLEALEPAAYAASVVELAPVILRHPAAAVRADLLRRIERARILEANPDLLAILPEERDVVVRAALLGALAAVGGHQGVARVAIDAQAGHPLVQQAALAALLKHAGDYGERVAGPILARLAMSASENDRALAARVLGEGNHTDRVAILARLIADPARAVRRSALRAAGLIPDPGLWPAVIAAAGDPGLAPEAQRVLARANPDVVPLIGAALAAPTAGLHHTMALMRAAGRIGGPQAIALLRAHARGGHAQIRHAALSALGTAGDQWLPPDVEVTLREEVQHAAAMFAAIEGLHGKPDSALLAEALRLDVASAVARILALLTMGEGSHAIQGALRALLGNAGGQRGYALEMLETQLPASQKALVMPMVEDIGPGERLRRWISVGLHAPAGSEQVLLSWVCLALPHTGISTWTRLCALDVVSTRMLGSCADAVAQAASDDDPRVREAANTVLARLARTAQPNEKTMLSLIERVIVLKSAPMFSLTPDDVLADVADVMEQVDVGAGTPIIEKGDAGDSLYVVVSGRVRVHDGDRELAIDGAGKVFGELALLDSEPRSASVTAIEPTRLLRLDQGVFFDLLAQRPEVGSGVIRMLTRMLRDRLQDLAALDARLRSGAPQAAA